MSELSSVGQDSARQSETEQHQSAPGEAEKDRAGRQKVGQCLQGWTRRNRVWHCPQNWTGVAGRAVLDSAEPGRIAQGQFGYGSGLCSTHES